MSRVRHGLFFKTTGLKIVRKITPVFIFIFFFNCVNNSVPETTDFTFSLVDVGQGLSQVGIVGLKAIVWDIGPPESYSNWLRQYKTLGSPYIEAIAISHTDLDHCGGLQGIDSMIKWSGLLISSPYEDTSFLRSQLIGFKKTSSIRCILQGDSIDLLRNIIIHCIWPPEGKSDSLPFNGDMKNRYSLAFTVSNHNTSIVISSDIDSTAAGKLARDYGKELHSDLLVVPHHGSDGSLQPMFLGFIRPQKALISCALENPYGHPSETVLSFLLWMGVEIRCTYIEKSITFQSNGYYWEEE